MTAVNNKKLPGEGINANYKRSSHDWIDILINCLDHIQKDIIEMEDFDTDNKNHIIRSTHHIKRFYEELEKEFFRKHLESPNSEKSGVQSNMTIHF